MTFSTNDAITAEEVRAKAAVAMGEVLSMVTIGELQAGKDPEEIVALVSRMTEVFELGRSVGKAEAAAEIFEMLEGEA